MNLEELKKRREENFLRHKKKKREYYLKKKLQLDNQESGTQKRETIDYDKELNNLSFEDFTSKLKEIAK
ncbi:MAG: hypothetical protein WHU93_03955, partial [Arcobacteraceae bacterium]